MRIDIWGRQNYGSSESHSSNDDVDFITCNHYPNRAELFQELTFLERRKGSHHNVLLAIKPSDLSFNCFMHYRCQRLSDTRWFVTLRFEEPLGTCKIVSCYIWEHKVPCSKPNNFVRLLYQVCLGNQHFQCIRGPFPFDSPKRTNWISRITSIVYPWWGTLWWRYCWLEVLNYFLCIHATPAAIRNAVKDLRNVREKLRDN